VGAQHLVAEALQRRQRVGERTCVALLRTAGDVDSDADEQWRTPGATRNRFRPLLNRRDSAGGGLDDSNED